MTRIIAGEWRGHQLPRLSTGTVRPTTDRARTVLFDTLWDVRGATVLDLYSGTGALGFEALSRGAVSLVSIDQDALYIREQKAWIKKHPKTYSGHVGDVENILGRLDATFDLVFADPPYATGLPEGVLLWLEEHMQADGRLVYERARKDAQPLESDVIVLEKEKVVAETRIQIYKVTRT